MLTHVTNFVIHVTNFVTKTFLYGRKKFQGEREKYHGENKKLLGGKSCDLRRQWRGLRRSHLFAGGEADVSGLMPIFAAAM